MITLIDIDKELEEARQRVQEHIEKSVLIAKLRLQVNLLQLLQQKENNIKKFRFDEFMQILLTLRMKITSFYGVDTEKIYSAFSMMPNQSYYKRLLETYSNLYVSNLKRDLKSELSISELMKLEEIIHKKPKN